MNIDPTHRCEVGRRLHRQGQGTKHDAVPARYHPEHCGRRIRNGEILQVLLFALLFAFGLQSLGEKGKPMLLFVEQVSEVMFRIVGIVMKFAPIGAFGAMAFTIGKYGVESWHPSRS